MTDEETTEEPSRAHELAKALADGIDQMAPIFDAAEGMKADLERRGWSDHVAEDIVHQWLINVMQQLWST